ncbi:uncharacterized protein [Penaeus vannamei]|uniref:uncharacterized protein isoform X1 n=1 Tax=Penaeus vannamei TaxID=6689 RepID=UPI00387F6D2C
MEYPTKEKLQLDAHPVPSAPEPSEASAANPREENTCCCGCSWRTGAITIAIIYLLVHLGFEGFLIFLLYMEGMRDVGLRVLIMIGVIGIAVIFISLLLHGAIKRRSPYLLAWMWWEGLNIGLGIIGLIFSLFLMGAAALSGLLGVSLRFCCFFVVYEYRSTLIAQPPKREANNAPA